MRIDRTVTDDRVTLVFEGRLDAAWSEPASAALEEAIRLGRTRIELDLSAVTFLTSVGLGAILRAHARFRAVKGTLAIVALNDAIRDMLRIARLDMLVDRAATAAAAPRASDATDATDASITLGQGWRGELARARDGDARATIARVRGARVALDGATVALGHLALANDAAGAAGLYGEGLAAGGTVAVAPAGAPRPDCLVSRPADGEALRDAGFVALDALVVRGRPAWHGFLDRADAPRIALRELAAALVAATGGPVAFVAIGESAGAFGAWARRSPDGWPRTASAMTPDELRANLRFAGEPMHAGESLAVVAVACPKDAVATLDPGISDALADAGPLLLHAHAATVSYRPVTRATADIAAAGDLLGEQPMRGVLHALHDDRTRHETAFVRGALWVFPIGGAR
jgi:anti-sigma B factor antagonist